MPVLRARVRLWNAALLSTLARCLEVREIQRRHFFPQKVILSYSLKYFRVQLTFSVICVGFRCTAEWFKNYYPCCLRKDTGSSRHQSCGCQPQGPASLSPCQCFSAFGLKNVSVALTAAAGLRARMWCLEVVKIQAQRCFHRTGRVSSSRWIL